MSDETLVLSTIEGPVAILTLNRPQALNALSPALIDALIRHLEHCDNDDTIRVIIITGAGRAFAAGRRHQGDGRCDADRYAYNRYDCPLGADCGGAQTRDRSRERICPRWWLRVGYDV